MENESFVRVWDNVELRSYPCDLCGCGISVNLMVKRGTLIERPFNIVKCSKCGHIRVDPRIPDEYISDLYDAQYYAGAGFDTTVAYKAQANTDYHDPIVGEVVATVVQLFNTPRSRTSLDVGCGLGDLVLGLRDAGFEAYGTDQSAYAQRFIRERGVPALPDIEQNVARYESTFDLITCVDVIEHVTSPRSLLAFARRLLKPGGYLLVLTGNWHVQRRLRGTPYVMPEGHLHYFTPTKLCDFFLAENLEASQVAENHTWGINRMLRAPSALRRVVQWGTAVLAPEFGPFPLARRPLSDASTNAPGS